MKRKSVIISAMLALMIMVGCSTCTFAATQTLANNNQAVQTVSVQNVSKTAAKDECAKFKEIAVKHAGLKMNEVKFIKAHKDLDDGVMKYDIEFIHGEQKFDYEILASDGRIIECSVESVYDD